LKITNREIKKVKDRQYREYGKVAIEPGDLMRYCRDHVHFTAYISHTYACSRSVTRKGKPRGPWIVNATPYAFYLEPETAPAAGG
jgi:hypothetical protein